MADAKRITTDCPIESSNVGGLSSENVKRSVRGLLRATHLLTVLKRHGLNCSSGQEAYGWLASVANDQAAELSAMINGQRCSAVTDMDSTKQHEGQKRQHSACIWPRNAPG
jgi:hypothetical protein